MLSDCRPARVTEGQPHPDPIVETACLANVLPPAPTYRHHISSCVAKAQLSSAQIETIIYANQRFELPPLPDSANLDTRIKSSDLSQDTCGTQSLCDTPTNASPT